MALVFAAAQGLALGLGARKSGAATHTMEGEAQVPVLLEDLIFHSDQEGLIDDLRVGGQSLMCSDKGVGWRAFHTQSQLEGARSIGLPIRQKTTVTLSCTMAAAAIALAGVGVRPIPPEEARDANDPAVSDRLNYIFGLGSTSCAPGVETVITAVARRSCKLGPIVLYPRVAAGYLDLAIRDVSYNNSPLGAGRVKGATIDELPIGFFDYLRTDLDGRMLDLDVEFNGALTITVFNANAGAIIVDGAVLVLPE